MSARDHDVKRPDPHLKPGNVTGNSDEVTVIAREGEKHAVGLDFIYVFSKVIVLEGIVRFACNMEGSTDV